MTFYLPYVFTGGTAAKAQEVNANFQQTKRFVEELETTQETLMDSVAGLETDKADVNGSSEQVFNVADPTSSSNAVNKSYLDNQLLPFRYIIVGLNLSKTSNQLFTVGVGGCYDNNYINPIANNSNLSMDTSGVTSASSTYNIYILAETTSPTNTSLVLTTGSNQPSVGTDDVYRKIGTLTTDSNNYVDTLTKEEI